MPCLTRSCLRDRRKQLFHGCVVAKRFAETGLPLPAQTQRIRFGYVGASPTCAVHVLQRGRGLVPQNCPRTLCTNAGAYPSCAFQVSAIQLLTALDSILTETVPCKPF